MPRTIRVRTGARLHFGLLAVQAPAGRNFGGVGLMVDEPGCELTVSETDRDDIVAAPEIALRLSAWRDVIRQSGAREASRPIRIEVSRAMPSHVGLGSGTQTALALAAAMAAREGEESVAATELARRVGRGARSALGIHGFQSGGLLVEAGQRWPDEISPLVARLDFPTDWRLLLVMPRDACGLAGDAERAAFARLGAMSREKTERLCRLVLMDLLPAVRVADFDSAAGALFDFGRLNGEFFAPAQGGVLANPCAAEIAGRLIERGTRGVAQTSWGPTIVVLCRDAAEATARRAEVIGSPWGNKLDCLITAARNCAASIGHGC